MEGRSVAGTEDVALLLPLGSGAWNTASDCGARRELGTWTWSAVWGVPAGSGRVKDSRLGSSGSAAVLLASSPSQRKHHTGDIEDRRWDSAPADGGAGAGAVAGAVDTAADWERETGTVLLRPLPATECAAECVEESVPGCGLGWPTGMGHSRRGVLLREGKMRAARCSSFPRRAQHSTSMTGPSSFSFLSFSWLRSPTLFPVLRRAKYEFRSERAVRCLRAEAHLRHGTER